MPFVPSKCHEWALASKVHHEVQSLYSVGNSAANLYMVSPHGQRRWSGRENIGQQWGVHPPCFCPSCTMGWFTLPARAGGWRVKVSCCICKTETLTVQHLCTTALGTFIENLQSSLGHLSEGKRLMNQPWTAPISNPASTHSYPDPGIYPELSDAFPHSGKFWFCVGIHVEFYNALCHSNVLCHCVIL